jgi:hypothetical protein
MEMAAFGGDGDQAVGCGEVTDVARQHEGRQQRQNKRSEEYPRQLSHLGRTDVRTRHEGSTVFVFANSNLEQPELDEVLQQRAALKSKGTDSRRSGCSDFSSTRMGLSIVVPEKAVEN